MKHHVKIGGEFWGNNESNSCMGEQVEVCGRLNVTINSHWIAKMEKLHH